MWFSEKIYVHPNHVIKVMTLTDVLFVVWGQSVKDMRQLRNLLLLWIFQDPWQKQITMRQWKQYQKQYIQLQNDGANEIRDNQQDTVLDVGISGDGSRQRRGFSSLNGMFTTISLTNGKILDIEIMSRYCKACKMKEPLKLSDRTQYDKWFATHECKLNHIGSAGAMEVSGSKRIFERSVRNRGLRYTKFLGDGDSKSFSSIKNVYSSVEVEKLECVGHVQKRVGSRLRSLKKNVKNLGGRGKLTDKTVDRLQNYYGIVVRGNVGNLRDESSNSCDFLPCGIVQRKQLACPLPKGRIKLVPFSKGRRHWSVDLQARTWFTTLRHRTCETNLWWTQSRQSSG